MICFCCVFVNGGEADHYDDENDGDHDDGDYDEYDDNNHVFPKFRLQHHTLPRS